MLLNNCLDFAAQSFTFCCTAIYTTTFLILTFKQMKIKLIKKKKLKYKAKKNETLYESDEEGKYEKENQKKTKPRAKRKY